MKIGYARVSTDDQSLDLQRDALARVGVDKLYEDTASGRTIDRPQLAECLRSLREGDNRTKQRTLHLRAVPGKGTASRCPPNPRKPFNGFATLRMRTPIQKLSVMRCDCTTCCCNALWQETNL